MRRVGNTANVPENFHYAYYNIASVMTPAPPEVPPPPVGPGLIRKVPVPQTFLSRHDIEVTIHDEDGTGRLRVPATCKVGNR